MSFMDLLGYSEAQPTLSAPRKQPRALLMMLVIFAAAGALAVDQGTPKNWADIDWVDVFGEGATSIIGLLWLHFTVAWRPAGPVTRLITWGFALLTFGFYLDALDELVRFNQTLWGQSFESLFIPAGIITLTLAAFGLHGEQKVLGRQQQRREAHYRNHQAIDRVTDLYNAEYCRQTLASGIDAKNPPTLWLIDLANFDAINRRFGFATGDEVLNRVANTLVATVPGDSLVCRYAGDRFTVLTHKPSLSLALEDSLSKLLSSAMTLALYDNIGEEIPCSVRVAITEPAVGENANQVLARANHILQAQK